jgi:hypothetical protein
MLSNKNQYFILCFALASIYAQCNKRLDCDNTVYNFEMGIKAYPDRDSINVGDTIWLEVNEPTTLKDAFSGKMIDYSDAANLSTTIGIAELISANQVNTNGNTFFTFFSQYGNEVVRPDTNNFREYRLTEISNMYKFKVAVIPKKIGIYKMFIGSAANVYRRRDQCTKAGFALNFVSTNQHLYYNEIILPGVTLPPGGGIYLFKVKQ